MIFEEITKGIIRRLLGVPIGDPSERPPRISARRRSHPRGVIEDKRRRCIRRVRDWEIRIPGGGREP